MHAQTSPLINQVHNKTTFPECAWVCARLTFKKVPKRRRLTWEEETPTGTSMLPGCLWTRSGSIREMEPQGDSSRARLRPPCFPPACLPVCPPAVKKKGTSTSVQKARDVRWGSRPPEVTTAKALRQSPPYFRIRERHTYIFSQWGSFNSTRVGPFKLKKINKSSGRGGGGGLRRPTLILPKGVLSSHDPIYKEYNAGNKNKINIDPLYYCT